MFQSGLFIYFTQSIASCVIGAVPLSYSKTPAQPMKKPVEITDFEREVYADVASKGEAGLQSHIMAKEAVKACVKLVRLGYMGRGRAEGGQARQYYVSGYHSPLPEAKPDALDAAIETVVTGAEPIAADKLVYVLTFPETGGVWVYGSSAAMIADPDNPLVIGRDRLNYLARAGFPIQFDGLVIYRTELRRKVKPTSTDNS